MNLESTDQILLPTLRFPMFGFSLLERPSVTESKSPSKRLKNEGIQEMGRGDYPFSAFTLDSDWRTVMTTLA